MFIDAHFYISFHFYIRERLRMNGFLPSANNCIGAIGKYPFYDYLKDNYISIATFNETTGKKSYVPSDPDYFNKYYHANKKPMTCNICGCVIMKKIGPHQKTMRCRLTNFMQQDTLRLKEDVITA